MVKRLGARSKSRFRTKRLRKPGGFRSKSRKRYVKRQVKLIKRVIQSTAETKYVHQLNVFSTNRTNPLGQWEYFDWTPVFTAPQGVGTREFIGTFINVKGCRVHAIAKFNFAGLAADSNRAVAVRLIWFKLKRSEQNNLALSTTELFLDGTSTQGIQRPVDKQRINVIYDHTYILQASANTYGSTYGSRLEFKKYYRYNIKMDVGSSNILGKITDRVYIAYFCENPLVTNPNQWGLDFEVQGTCYYTDT